MRRNWIKIYVDQCLRGTMISELAAAERWAWIGLLLMAGDSNEDGKIFLRKNTSGELIGYSDTTLAELLGLTLKELRSARSKMIEFGKISINKNGVITIQKWKKYQSEYNRQKQYREPYRESDENNCNPESNQSNPLELDKDRDKDLEEDKKEEYPPEFESFWKEYPKHKGKKVAFNAWKEHPKKNHVELEVAAQNYRKECINLKTDMEFMKDPSGFIRLAKEYWKDYLGEVIVGKVGESRLPEKTEDKKKEDDEYVEARMRKEQELRSEMDGIVTDFDTREVRVKDELAIWHKEYYEKN